MSRSTLFISTLAIAVGCGGRESGTNAGASGGGMTAGSSMGAGSDSGAGGGSSGTITSAATRSTNAGSGTTTTGSVSSSGPVPCIVTTCDSNCFDNCGNGCAGGSCNTSGSTSTGSCTLNSDCAPGFLCTIGQCRAQCASDIDCRGGTCISGVCRPLAQETAQLDGGAPRYHRGAGATCPSQRGPNTASFPPCATPASPSAARPMRTATMPERTAAVSITFLDPPCARTMSASPIRIVPRGRRASAVARLRTTARTRAYRVATASLTRTAVPVASARHHPRRWNAQDRDPIIATRRRTHAPTMRTVQRSTLGLAW
jgi:hypothetical protein